MRLRATGFSVFPVCLLLASFWAASAPCEVWAGGLRLLPENSMYFEYNGLPLLSVVYLADARPVPKGAADWDKLAAHGNHYYLTAHSTWVRASWPEAAALITSDSNWAHVRSVCQGALEHDIIISLVFWSYKWNYAAQSGTPSDVINAHQDVHLKSIEQCVKYTWDLPNVTYNFMWEYNVRRAMDPDGAFHRWWVDQMKAEGRKNNPDVEHLFSIEYGGTHPRENHADFLVEEDGNVFSSTGTGRRGDQLPLCQSYKTPLVTWAMDQPYGDEHYWSPDEVRAVIPNGIHPSNNFTRISDETLDYFLQVRCFVENVRTWGNEPGDEISALHLPRYAPGARPSLTNPGGYTAGARQAGGVLEFACVYTDADNDAPAQAEVWVDLNGDGRFAPNAADGERFVMKASGADYRSGVTYTVSGARPARSGNVNYVFRFADRHWYPPATGGVIPPNNRGISYEHRTVAFE